MRKRCGCLYSQFSTMKYKYYKFVTKGSVSHSVNCLITKYAFLHESYMVHLGPLVVVYPRYGVAQLLVRYLRSVCGYHDFYKSKNHRLKFSKTWYISSLS